MSDSNAQDDDSWGSENDEVLDDKEHEAPTKEKGESCQERESNEIPNPIQTRISLDFAKERQFDHSQRAGRIQLFRKAENVISLAVLAILQFAVGLFRSVSYGKASVQSSLNMHLNKALCTVFFPSGAAWGGGGAPPSGKINCAQSLVQGPSQRM